MSHITLTSDNFEQEVLQFDGVVLVDFWAPWCGPCKMLSPIIDELTEEYKDNEGVKIGKVNVDENNDLAAKYSVMSIPALKIFKNGQVVDEAVGLQTREDLKEKLGSQLE